MGFPPGRGLRDPSGENTLMSTYYGGSAIETVQCLTIDNDNNFYIGGSVFGSNTVHLPTPSPFPSNAYYQDRNGSYDDGFITEFDDNGKLVWATIFGGGGVDEVMGLTTDAAGNLFITGTSTSGNGGSGNFQNAPVYSQLQLGAMPAVTPYTGSYIDDNNGFLTSDAFIAKFSATHALEWSTFFGGSYGDENYFTYLSPGSLFGNYVPHKLIKVNSIGQVYITGFTSSTNFPVKNPGSITGIYYDNSYNGGNNDAFIAKFSDHYAKLWTTYYGGNQNDVPTGIDIDKTGNVYITGVTNSPASGGFPLQTSQTGSYYQGILNKTTSSSAYDGFVAKLNYSANALVWSSYYGGQNDDAIYSMSFTSTGYNLIIAGVTTTPDNITNKFPLRDIPGSADYFDGMFGLAPTPPNGPDGFISEIKNVCVTCRDAEALETRSTLLENNNLIIYPNPSTGKITITTQDISNYTLSIFDMEGREVHTIKNDGGKKGSFDLQLKAGVYAARVALQNKVFYKKIVIQ